MSRLKEEFLDYVAECINDDWDAHEDFQHSTIDFYGPDDDTNIKCSLPEEHTSIIKMRKALAALGEVPNYYWRDHVGHLHFAVQGWKCPDCGWVLNATVD